jgi:hypothetical protein
MLSMLIGAIAVLMVTMAVALSRSGQDNTTMFGCYGHTLLTNRYFSSFDGTTPVYSPGYIAYYPHAWCRHQGTS